MIKNFTLSPEQKAEFLRLESISWVAIEKTMKDHWNEMLDIVILENITNLTELKKVKQAIEMKLLSVLSILQQPEFRTEICIDSRIKTLRE